MPLYNNITVSPDQAYDSIVYLYIAISQSALDPVYDNILYLYFVLLFSNLIGNPEARKQKGQPRIDNSKTPALKKQHEDKQNTKTQHNTQRAKDEQHGHHQNQGVNPGVREG